MNLKKHQRLDIYKIYLYVKDPFKPKYQLLIKEREKAEIKELQNYLDIYFTANRFADYSHTTDDVYENVEEYKPLQKKRMLIVFDNIIGDMEEANQKVSAKT